MKTSAYARKVSLYSFFVNITSQHIQPGTFNMIVLFKQINDLNV